MSDWTMTGGTPTVTYTISDSNPAVVMTDDGMGATFNPAAMTEGRPYPYSIGGQWYAAVKDGTGAMDIYAFRRPFLARVRSWLAELRGAA